MSQGAMEELMELLKRADPIVDADVSTPPFRPLDLPIARTRDVSPLDRAKPAIRTALLASVAAALVVVLTVPLYRGLRGDRAASPNDPGAPSRSISATPSTSLIPPSFEAAAGWEVVSTGPIQASKEFDAPRTWAATVDLGEDAGSGGVIPTGASTIPTRALLQLGPEDIVIVAQWAHPHDATVPSPLYPTTHVPLSISDADIGRQWEGQPVSSIPEYRIGAYLNEQFYDVRLYFGLQSPSQATLDLAEAELARLQFSGLDGTPTS